MPKIRSIRHKVGSFLTVELLSYKNRTCNIGKVYQEDQSFTEYIRLGLRKLSLPDKQVIKSLLIVTAYIMIICIVN